MLVAVLVDHGRISDTHVLTFTVWYESRETGDELHRLECHLRRPIAVGRLRHRSGIIKRGFNYTRA